MQLTLVKPSDELEEAYEDFRADWKRRQEKIVPYAVRGEGLTYPQLMEFLYRRAGGRTSSLYRVFSD